MKKHSKTAIATVIIIVLCLCMASCGDKDTHKDLWLNAAYSEDTSLGEGKKIVIAEVITPEKSVTFEIKTDKETLGDALMEHKLISGEKGAYGLYVKFVNGIEADYDKDKSYWAIEKDGESLMTGVDSEKLKDNSHYEFIYTVN